MNGQSELDDLRRRLEDHALNGMLADAESTALQLLTLIPDDATVWFRLGTVQLQCNRSADAELAIRKAIALDPTSASHWSLLGTVQYMQRRWHDAASACRESLGRDDQDAATWGTLGAALWALDDLERAVEAYQQSLQISSDDLHTLMNYGRLLLDRKLPEQALGAFEKVLACDPSKVEAWLATGDAFLRIEHHDHAMVAYQRAIELSHGSREIRYRIVDAMVRMGPVDLVEPLVEHIRSEEPTTPESLMLLAVLRQRQVRLREVGEALAACLRVHSSSSFHSNMLCLIQYGDGASLARNMSYHLSWGQAFAEPLLPIERPLVESRQGGALRLGFISADFGQHPTGFMVLPLLENLDRRKIQVTCYSDRRERDEYTNRFHTASDRWRRIVNVSDDALAEQIREDKIDVLFDLMGHNGNRLLVFARKPAPVQVSWFGYVGSTGVGTIDYLLADRFHVTPDEERFYVERILRMPNDYACYEPPSNVPDVCSLPALSKTAITFGCFNNPAKISPRTVSLWAKVIQRVSDATLLLKYRGYEQRQLRERIKNEFAQRGIDPARVFFEGGCATPQELMGAYNRVDIALDTQPYSGGLTTCEALWMGVPVITFSGKTFAGRHSVSHLTNAGYPQFIASDWHGYAELAVEWAGRLGELAAIRSGMRERVRQSPLCDRPAFARDFTSLIRATWESVATR